MLYNSLAYRLHLIGDATAVDYIQIGLKLAREKGSLQILPYFYSTSGEIALANNDVDAAEKYFNDGLVLAEKIPNLERMAGLTANLGLVARQRGAADLARERLKTALTLAEQMGNRHLEVRVRIWLAPLLSPEEALSYLDDAYTLAEQGGLRNLLEEITALQKNLSHPP